MTLAKVIDFVKSHKNIHILTTANTFELLNTYQSTPISKDVTIIDVNTQKSINELIKIMKIILIIVHHIQHLINVLLMQNQSFTNRGTQNV